MFEIIQSSTIRADYVTIAVTFFIIWACFTARIYGLSHKSLVINQK